MSVSVTVGIVGILLFGLGVGFFIHVKRSLQHELKKRAELIANLERRLKEQQDELVREKAQSEATHNEIQKLANARKDFVANVSHELKTPLTSIRGYAETLKNGALNDMTTAGRFVGKIERNAGQLQNLIEDLLELSELDSGRRPLELSDVNLDDLIMELHDDFNHALKAKNQYLERDIASNLQVKAQPAALKQVLNNLLDNAIKYSPEGVGIRLVAYPRGEFCEIIVEDRGIGIPSTDLPHIFERFYRVDKARSREMGGTGLGLAIVKHLVKAQNGEVLVTSQPERGSRFLVILPRVF